MDIIQEAKAYLKQPSYEWEDLDTCHDLISRLVDRLEWKSINNCPVDDIVLFNVNDYLNSYDANVCIGFMNNEMEYISVSNGKQLMETPTHWLPLPPVGDK